MSNLFQKLELEAFRAGINPRTQESRDWFRRRVQRLTRINRDALMREDEINRRASHSYGSMFMYFYELFEEPYKSRLWQMNLHMVLL